MRTLKTLPAHSDTNPPSQSPLRAGRWARARHAAAELTPDAIEQVAQRVAQLLSHGQPQPGARESSNPAPAQLLTADQLARHLGLNRAWIYEHANELGAIRIGNGPRARLRFNLQMAIHAIQARDRDRYALPSVRRSLRLLEPSLASHESRLYPCFLSMTLVREGSCLGSVLVVGSGG